MEDTYIHCFIKFGGKRAIMDLYENGTVYCNSVQYFRTLEDKYRGDTYEGASYIKNYPPGKFLIELEGKVIDYEFNYLNLHVKEAYEKTLGNIYSLFCLSSKVLRGSKPVTIDKRIKDFGDTALLVKDSFRFFELMKEALKQRQLDYVTGFVEYYDKHLYTGDVDLFNKPSDYSYQNEFRYYIRRRSYEPLILNIGSLKDIAEIYPASEFIDTFEASEKK